MRGKEWMGEGREEEREGKRNDVKITNAYSMYEEIDKISYMIKRKPAFHSESEPSVSGVALESERPSVPEGTRLSTCSVRIA